MSFYAILMLLSLLGVLVMLNIALEREQEQREENSRVAIEEQIDKETDLYHIGKFDGCYCLSRRLHFDK